MDIEMRETQAKQAGKPRRSGGGCLFIPKKFQTRAVLAWLRRTHAWTGVYGALFFFCLGITGFYLNHRTTQMHIEGGAAREVAALSLPVEPGLIDSEAALAAWLKKELEITVDPVRKRAREGGPVSFGGRARDQAAQFSVTFRGPNAVITGEYEAGANRVGVKRADASLLKTLIDMHKAAGIGAMFTLLKDSMAGAMMFMSISGILLWTRFHGPRLAALGILAAVATMTAFAISGAWVGWAAP